MSREKRVKDIMRPLEEYQKILADSNLKSSLSYFRKSNNHRPKVLIVVDREPKSEAEVIGFLALEDIVRGVEAFVSEKTACVDSPPIFWEGLFTEECRNEMEKRVKDLMTPIQATVNKNDNLMKALHVMDSLNLRRVLVVDGQNPVGIIRMEEIFEEIAFIAQETS